MRVLFFFLGPKARGGCAQEKSGLTPLEVHNTPKSLGFAPSPHASPTHRCLLTVRTTVSRETGFERVGSPALQALKEVGLTRHSVQTTVVGREH
ncbi:hypothetical protein R1flu_024672 [Riccia fluitans]|uniref:Ribosomal protein L30 n=1 Tax=Riccia fluitans TaxID=41844 RepID=A0ABD1XVJ9_9MARC